MMRLRGRRRGWDQQQGGGESCGKERHGFLPHWFRITIR